MLIAGGILTLLGWSGLCILFGYRLRGREVYLQAAAFVNRYMRPPDAEAVRRAALVAERVDPLPRHVDEEDESERRHNMR